MEKTLLVIFSIILLLFVKAFVDLYRIKKALELKVEWVQKSIFDFDSGENWIYSKALNRMLTKEASVEIERYFDRRCDELMLKQDLLIEHLGLEFFHSRNENLFTPAHFKVVKKEKKKSPSK